MSRLVALYPFRFIDPASGKWVQARDKASLADIAARHERWQVTGDAELRKGEGDTFKPWNALPWRTGPLPSDPEPDLNPEIDDAERPPRNASSAPLRHVLRAPRPMEVDERCRGSVPQARARVVKRAPTLHPHKTERPSN